MLALSECVICLTVCLAPPVASTTLFLLMFVTVPSVPLHKIPDYWSCIVCDDVNVQPMDVALKSKSFGGLLHEEEEACGNME